MSLEKIQWNKVTWYSKLIAVFLFFVIWIWGIYLGSEFQKIRFEIRENRLAASRPIVDTKIHYESKKHGFSLDLPARWRNYQIEKAGEPMGSYNFLLPATDGLYHGTFSIDALPKDQLTEEDKQKFLDPETQGALGTYLGENNTYVYVYGTGDSRDTFFDFEAPNSEAYYGPMKEAREVIIPTFKILQIK